MKLLIIGDSHGNIANLKHVMGFAKSIKAVVVIHTGDWTDMKSVSTVLEYNIPLYSCLGNGDIHEDIKKEFKDFLEIEIDGLKIGITHGSRDISKYFSNKKLDIIFYGHIHSQDDGIHNGIRTIRPGALENGINFAIFDTETKMVEFIHE